jgi:leader peptidase (prepilin peptidase)/N-methyltransferase
VADSHDIAVSEAIAVSSDHAVRANAYSGARRSEEGAAVATVSGVIPPAVSSKTSAATAAIAAWRGEQTLGRVLTLGGIGLGIAASISWRDHVAPISVVAIAVTLSALTVAALVDVAERRIPNGCVLVAAGSVVAAVVASVLGDTGGWTGAGLGALVAGGPLLITHLLSPAGLGFGDVKAGTVLGGALGLVAPVLAAGGLVVALLLAAVGALAARRRDVPLGPWLVVGAVAALVGGHGLAVTPW